MITCDMTIMLPSSARRMSLGRCHQLEVKIDSGAKYFGRKAKVNIAAEHRKLEKEIQKQNDLFEL